MASSKAMINSTLVLRLLTLLLLGASIVVLVTDKVTYSDGTKTTFKDAIAYRYFINIMDMHDWPTPFSL